MSSPLLLLLGGALLGFSLFQLRRVLAAYRRLTAFRCGFDPNGRISLAEENEPRTAALADELERLGFERLGLFWEQLGAASRLDTVTFSHAGAGAFATIFHLRSGEPRLFFLTGFEGGGAALTGAYDRPAGDARDRLLSGMPGRPLAEVLASHAQSVERLVSRGFRPHKAFDRAARLRVAEEWYQHPMERKRFRRGLVPAVAAPAVMAVVGLCLAVLWAGG